MAVLALCGLWAGVMGGNMRPGVYRIRQKPAKSHV